jgi:Na+/H+ antiporter NhaC
MTEPGITSLAPVLVTLIVALSMRNVLVGLFAGVLTAVIMVSDSGALMFLPDLVKDHLVPEVADSYNASVLVLLAFIGGFVKLVETSGGGTAFAQAAANWVSTRARAQIGAWCGGILIFFSDLGTPLIVGPVFQPLMDRLRLSRQKLAFILDSTSSPVAILIPIIGWGVFIMSVIKRAFEANNVSWDEWDAFVAAIPYQFYAWLAIFMVPALTLLRFDYGAMASVESAAKNLAVAELEPRPLANERATPILVWLPLVTLGTALFAILGMQGFPFEQIAGADFRAGLSAAYLLAAVVLVVLLVARGIKSTTETFATYIQGVTGMMPIAATLVLAWALGSLSEQMGTGVFVAEIAREGLAGWLLPAVTFLLAAVISFATGSSWGTIIIMMPLAIPASIATSADLAVTIGAVLSGGLFGDHSSPVSETTILSSTGASTTPLEHFRTQLPYALTNGAIAFCVFIVAGMRASPWLTVGAVLVQLSVLLLLRRFLVNFRNP